ncbi:MAG TPA: transposase [Aridibacter sp.]|nr:transposase [Aridibacter sp.]
MPQRKSVRLRSARYESGTHFVTITTKDRVRSFENPEMAERTINVLLNLREKHKFQLFSYCLMPDHFHALIRVDDSDLDLSSICGRFKGLTTREFWHFGDGKLWQRGFYERIVKGDDAIYDCVRYIRENPVKAGLVDRWDKWPYYGEPDLDGWLF